MHDTLPQPKPRSRLRTGWAILKATVRDFLRHDAMSFAAAVAFYAALAIAPLLVVVTTGLSLVLTDGQQTEVAEQLRTIMGTQAGDIAANVMRQAERPSTASLSGIAGLCVLTYSATVVFAQLQHALNVINDVQPRPKDGVMAWVRTRLLSLGMVISVGFLLLVSMLVSAAIGVVHNHVNAVAAGPGWLWTGVNQLASILIFWLLFTLIYRVLPDVDTAWRDAWFGGAVTALLFALGQWGIGEYLGRSNPGSAYGGAASGLLAMLVWVYYASIIVFIGAELTQARAAAHGRRPEPSGHAVRIDKREITQDK